MALGSTQPKTEMGTSHLTGSEKQPVCTFDNFTAIHKQIVYKMYESRRLTTLWPSTACLLG
jgi:hypothetical protein